MRREPSGYDMLLSDSARAAVDTTDPDRYVMWVEVRESLLNDPTTDNPLVQLAAPREHLQDELYLVSTSGIWLTYRFLNQLVIGVAAILFRPNFRQFATGP